MYLTVDKPFDTASNWGMSFTYTLSDAKRNGSRDNGNPDVCWNGGRPEKYNFIIPNAWAYRQLDLRLTKEFQVWGGDSVELILDAINVFNFKNYNGFEQCLCSTEYGDPRSQFLPTRSFQVGLRYRW